jgi:hypothetical protein
LCFCIYRNEASLPAKDEPLLVALLLYLLGTMELCFHTGFEPLRILVVVLLLAKANPLACGGFSFFF